MIAYNEKTRRFTLETENTSYFMCIDSIGMLRNLYYGEKLISAEDVELEQPQITFEDTVLPQRMEYITKERLFCKEPDILTRFPDGTRDLRLRYKSHDIKSGENFQELTIVLKDEFYDFEVALGYKIYEGLDLIEKNAVITNNCEGEVVLDRARTASLYPAFNEKLKLMHLAGTWGSEYRYQNVKLDTIGKYTISNNRGVCAAHQHVPFFAVSDENACETAGRVWYGLLHWSGDFDIDIERSFDNQVTITAGVGDYDTVITLKKGESFETPVLTVGFAAGGYEEMSKTLYDYQYDVLLPHERIKKIFPIIYNSWYPYEFDVNEEKCLGFIEKAKRIGAELFVIDDGWFVRRKNETDGLGDWWCDAEKFPRGLAPVADKAHELGMLFGLWIEPEMVNPGSDLYKAHPEWVLSFPNRENTKKRHQYVLNLAREDVFEFCRDTLDRIITEFNLDYLKWDMNSYIAESGENLGDMRIKYIKNLYRLWEHMNKKYPNLLLENCASGGGRSDYGMAPYADRINRSDNSDSCDVLKIHEGFSTIFLPRLAGGAGNICVNPHGYSLRNVPLKFRAELGMTGSMSVGINILKSSEEELEELTKYIAEYKTIRHITQNAYFYRLASAFTGNIAAWEYLARSGDEAIVFVFANDCNFVLSVPPTPIKLRGLERKALYSVSGEGMKDMTVHGDYLEKVGINVKPRPCDYFSRVIKIKKIK